MKKRIYSASMLAVFEKKFKNNHSKFIFGSPCTIDDFGKTLTIQKKKVTIVGMNDNKEIIVKDNASEFYYDVPFDTIRPVCKPVTKK